jgi:hydroxymethylbilane synthase
MNETIIIGTRGSDLALIQTEIIKKQLNLIAPEIQIVVKIIKTKGDKNKSPIPLDTTGKDWFTKEIDRALLQGEIDIAVHSLKDLSEDLPEGLVIAAIPKREDAREALISQGNVTFEQLKKRAIIGTDSTRRKAQILNKRNDVIVKSIRGNVDGRVKKLDNGEYDAVVLAVAGLKRLGLENKITEYFSDTDFIPSPGQGALAVVIRKNNKTLLKLLQKLTHHSTVSATIAERTFSKICGGGCSLPIGAYALSQKNSLILYGMIGSLDGKHVLKDFIRGNSSDAEVLGKKLAEKLLKKSSPWFVSNNIPNDKKYVIVTRPEKENKTFIKGLEKIGLHAYSYPTIAISELKISQATKQYLLDLASFDWILFTSVNGVRFFMKALKEAKVDLLVLKQVKIAAVGSKTAEILKKQQLTVHVIPAEFTAGNLANELKNVKDKKILLPRVDIATPLLVPSFEKKGAQVVNIPVYQTKFVFSLDKTFKNLSENKKIICITFTSPSTVRGFIKNIETMKLNKAVFSIPVLAIGPVTTKSLKKFGFQKIYTANTFTEEGMLAKLKEVIL